MSLLSLVLHYLISHLEDASLQTFIDLSVLRQHSIFLVFNPSIYIVQDLIKSVRHSEQVVLIHFYCPAVDKLLKFEA